ncbi:MULTISPECIES: response regulator transcription factor [unclassified Bacillus (in: firmicutes)]|uniref:response regulator transcription factor n=1 Tax=unclassified Bacillus (in: firmicutes) TaxID=185979 RepID=UPI0006AEA937|nr:MULTISPECIES: response regulator transcription factor [unclassified Bacillus (in: firmicutes)]ALC84450.1 transcriptional regulator [Bacillus sp. FJAT-22090]MDF2065204.1 response regulator transcription factor [Bacillus sp. Cr_A10]
MTTILVVDDEQDMRKLVEMHLQKAGLQVIQAENGNQAIELLQSTEIDLILLDVMMPEKDGFAVCEEIRQFSEVPIIFLTALDAKSDLVKGLQLGGDDYVVKPFTAMELTARINAILRRTGYSSNNDIITKGILVNDIVGRQLKRDGFKIVLTLKEYELIYLFMENEGKVFSREQLLELLWGIQYEGGTRTVDTHIKTLRLKLGEVAGKYIDTVWGIGYRFEVKE